MGTVPPYAATARGPAPGDTSRRDISPLHGPARIRREIEPRGPPFPLDRAAIMAQMTVPKNMKAVEIRRPGGPEVLEPTERPGPVPKANGILIKVAAAGGNRPDVLQRSGNYPVPPDASDLPGLEVAGEVVAKGDAVSMWRTGEKVCALVHGGGYGEYCVAPEVQALPVPRGLSLVEAASLPETFFTLWSKR